jgi:hypothetical protein
MLRRTSKRVKELIDMMRLSVVVRLNMSFLSVYIFYLYNYLQT